MNMKKYKLIKGDRRGLYRIEALRSFGDIKKGDIGGRVSGEHNLSHNGNCWIYFHGIVFGQGLVSGNGRVSGNGLVSDYGMVSGIGVVCGEGVVCGYGWVRGMTVVAAGKVACDQDIAVFGPIGSRGGYTTFVRRGDGICVVCGCFTGSLTEFARAVRKNYKKGHKYRLQYDMAIKFAKLIIKNNNT